MFNELMRWNPSEELYTWHRDIDDLFSRFFGRTEAPANGWMPRMETCRNENDYVVRIDLPGVDPKDVSVHVEGNVLTISGERKSEDTNAEYRETFYGKFERSLTLPQGVETDKIAAQYQNGVLEVRVPLPAQLAGRKIPIQIEQKETKKIDSKAA
jgi:HSP20 family protein